MAKHHEQPSDHITEFSDIPPSPDAVYNSEGHIKDSFLRKLACESLEMDAQRIENLRSRERLTPEQKTEIVNLRERAQFLRSKMVNVGMSDAQFIEMRVHAMRCLECKQEMDKIRGDLPIDGLPLS